MIEFIIGIIVGVILGIAAMCFVFIGGKEIDYEQSDRKIAI